MDVSASQTASGGRGGAGVDPRRTAARSCARVPSPTCALRALPPMATTPWRDRRDQCTENIPWGFVTCQEMHAIPPVAFGRSQQETRSKRAAGESWGATLNEASSAVFKGLSSVAIIICYLKCAYNGWIMSFTSLSRTKTMWLFYSKFSL